MALAIFFQPGSTQLTVRFLTTAGEFNLDSQRPLSLNQNTNVWVVASGNTVTLYLNNAQNPESVTIGSQFTRASGPATLYVSNPWSTPALASIGSIQMTPI